LIKQLRQDVETMTLVPKASEYIDGLASRGKIDFKTRKIAHKKVTLPAKVDIATPHKKEIIMKLLAFLGFFSIFTTRRPTVVVLVQEHGADSSFGATPLDLELCSGDKIVYDELTALLGDNGKGPGVGQPGKGGVGPSYGGTDHRSKYYRKYVRI
jgi:hypothetical protein